MKKVIAFLVMGFVLSTAFISASSNLQKSLLNDINFKTNFTTTKNGVNNEVLSNNSLISNNWNIEQSNSKYSLKSDTYYINGNSKVYYDNSKQVGLNPTDGDLYLNINGQNEYTQPRTESGAVVAMEAGQKIRNNISLSNMSSLSTKLTFQ